ncbi:hypothetical protein [Okeania sp.]|uniref:hypothetical protein n=1 Tax=Okeania sp. TaxID=3100323 RepID=UPI002B4B12CA|nr:hypothetical protein [Okeania sp.]MEB3339650.1 hypothetical protein [Okeania sp.]
MNFPQNEAKKGTDIVEKGTEITNISQIISLEDMEKVLVKIFMSLAPKFSGGYVPISNLGTEFHRLYGQPITKAIKRFQPSKKFPKFLELCSSLKLYQSEEGRWFVSLI